MTTSAALTFLGGAGGTVTGSKHLLEHDGRRILLDCGLFQGLKPLRLRNWAPPPLDPRELDAVVLSHAHIDHSGYLPRLVRHGFRGPVYCTPGTADLLRILLPDAAHLQEEEARFANRHRTSRHEPAEPLFTIDDAERALARVQRVAWRTPFAPAPGFSVQLLHAGHIVGAAIVQCDVGERRVVFSGDLGRYGAPIVLDPDSVPRADALLVESTYGDRLHPTGDASAPIVTAVERAVAEKGWLLIPAFAVGRAQEILLALRQLERGGRIPVLPVYLDSPMAIEATVVYATHPEEHDAELHAEAARDGKPFVPQRLHLSRTVEESKRLNGVDGPAILLAGSGMATGGRILHHLMRLLPDPRTTVLLVGYQAAGTRGRSLREGATELKMFGRFVRVRARVMVSDAHSAHADRGELLRWLRGFAQPPAMTYVVHGEPSAASALREAIERELGWPAMAAGDGQRVSV